MQFDSRSVRFTTRSIAIAAVRRLPARLAPTTLIVLMITLFAPAAWAQYTESVLYSFCSASGCSDGEYPYASVVSDSEGNLFGTTYGGGTLGYGLVFELSPPTAGSGPWTETVLHSSCSVGDCADGGNSVAAVIFDSSGNLYGTTKNFGANGGYGVAFELSPPSAGSGPWTESVLQDFLDGAGGGFPDASLILDSHGDLYGPFLYGGGGNNDNSNGGIYELSPPVGGSGPWTESVLFGFGTCECGSGGVAPEASLIFDSSGNLYGTTNQGGADNLGVVFELSPPSGGSGPWTESALYNFCSAKNCTDGVSPVAGLILDSKGNLFGTTEEGGSLGYGVVFELSPPSGGSGPWTENVLHNFAGNPSDGANPYASLIFDSRGNLYGTTNSGGSLGAGVVFELSPPSGSGPWTETVLYAFSGGSDGYNPEAGLIFDSHGNLYGTTVNGGTGSRGVVFKLSPNTSTTVISSLNPSEPGQAVTFTATVSGGSSPTGTVSFTSSSLTISGCGLVALAFDKAQCTTTFETGGTYSIAAIYSGDSKNGASSGTLTQLVSLPATATTVTSGLNPSTVGQPVTFTAAVGGGSSPTGTVGFSANGTTVSGCGAVTLASDKAECTTTFATKGSYAVVATYSGNSKNAGSSGTLTQVVGATTTTVTSSLNPSTSGESITLTATVAPAGPPTPTGTVGFTSLGSAITGCSDVTLATSRTAECTTTTLPVGTDAILATYSGDTNYSGSSGTFSQLVNPIPTPVQFFTMTPCRIVDTRGPDGYFGGPEFTAGETRNFTLPVGPCAGIPTNASAYSLNVTVVPPGPLGYLTIWPTGEGQPTVSTLNSLDGRTKANAAIVPAGTSGAVSVYVNNTSNVLLDIDGYFAASSSGSLELYPLVPCRVADTRKATGPLGGPALVAKTERDFPIQSSSCGIPSSVQAYSLNFTVVPPATGDALDYLTVWPEGVTQPVVSTLNNFTGTIVANAAIVPAGKNGGVAVYPSDATNLVIDVNGYFAPAGTGSGLQLYALTPCRVLDTRKTTGAFSNDLTVQVNASACKPPITAQAYVFNATVVPTGDLGYLTLWPDEETQPVVSTLNAEDGAITSNMAIVPNKDGETDAYASGTTQLILDISAYFAP